MSGYEKFPTKVGSLDQSFTVLFHSAQIDENKMKKIRSFLSAMLKNEAPALIYALVIDSIGGTFRIKFLEILNVQPITKDAEIT